MKFKRRHLLALAGFGGLGLALTNKQITSRLVVPAELTSTASTPPKPATDDLLLRFVAIADSGAGDRNQFASGNAMATYHKNHPYSLVVMAGDNIYDQGEIDRVGVAFEQPYAPLLKQGVKFRACLGNHDIRTANGDPQVRYAGFNMQGRYYTYREKDVQFFVLDTNYNADWKDQLAWLDAELGRSNAVWKIVYGHHPVYSAGHYGDDPTMIKRLTPLFKKHQVRLYINGHEHNYERTTDIEGTTYLITGIGGASLRRIRGGKRTAYAVSRFGFSAIEVYADRLEIQGIGTDGMVFDRGVVPRKVGALV